MHFKWLQKPLFSVSPKNERRSTKSTVATKESDIRIGDIRGYGRVESREVIIFEKRKFLNNLEVVQRKLVKNWWCIDDKRALTVVERSTTRRQKYERKDNENLLTVIKEKIENKI